MEINFFPINIDFEEFQISRTKYSDKTLKELRNKYNKSHSFLEMVIIYTYLILMVVFWGKYAEFFNSLSVIFGLLGAGL